MKPQAFHRLYPPTGGEGGSSLLASVAVFDLQNISEGGSRLTPQKDVGQKGTPTILPGVISALEQIKVWGIDHISYSLLEINNRIAEHLSSLGFQLPDSSQRSPHMFGAIIPDKYKGNLVSELSKRKI